MNPKLLRTIGDWFNDIRVSNRYPTISIDPPVFSCADTDNPSVYVDAETETSLARITVWASQECNMEVVSKATGETLFFKQILIDDNNYEEKGAAFLLSLRARGY